MFCWRDNWWVYLMMGFLQCDLIPSWATKGWLHVLSREFPTLAFHASVTNPFGKVVLPTLVLKFYIYLLGVYHLSLPSVLIRFSWSCCGFPREFAHLLWVATKIYFGLIIEGVRQIITLGTCAESNKSPLVSHVLTLNISFFVHMSRVHFSLFFDNLLAWKVTSRQSLLDLLDIQMWGNHLSSTLCAQSWCAKWPLFLERQKCGSILPSQSASS